jgi:hypothetical protein
MKLIKSDIVIAVILFSGWLFYLIYDGTTRFDVNQKITLPLFIAAELTALAILYAAGRYFTAKKSKEINQKISSMMVDPEDEQTQVETASENSKS